MTENEVTTYQVYCIRWVQLLVYFLANFTNGLASGTFAPIESETATFFSITTTQVDALAIVFSFLYVVGTILSICLNRSVSIRTGMIVGSVLNLGVIIRLFALISPSTGYPALIIGQLFPAISGPLFMNITALFAARWFAPKQRDIATAIGSIANPLGSAIGYLLPSLIVSDGYASTPFLTLLLIEACFTALTTLLVIIIFRSNPPSPPSPSEEQHLSIDIKRDLIGLLTNRHYLILLFGFSLGYAILSAITTVLYQLIEPIGYTSTDAGIFGAVVIVTGLTNACIAGVIMDRTHAYRLILRILLVGAVLSGIYFILILQPNKFYPLAVAIGLIGFFLLPLLPVSFECAVECTYPIRAEWSTGLLLCTGSVLGGILTFVLEALLKLGPVSNSGVVITPASIFILCIFVVATVVMFFYNGPYLRLEAERKAVMAPSTEAEREAVTVPPAEVELEAVTALTTET